MEWNMYSVYSKLAMLCSAFGRRRATEAIYYTLEYNISRLGDNARGYVIDTQQEMLKIEKIVIDYSKNIYITNMDLHYLTLNIAMSLATNVIELIDTYPEITHNRSDECIRDGISTILERIVENLENDIHDWLYTNVKTVAKVYNKQIDINRIKHIKARYMLDEVIGDISIDIANLIISENIHAAVLTKIVKGIDEFKLIVPVSVFHDSVVALAS